MVIKVAGESDSWCDLILSRWSPCKSWELYDTYGYYFATNIDQRSPVDRFHSCLHCSRCTTNAPPSPMSSKLIFRYALFDHRSPLVYDLTVDLILHATEWLTIMVNYVIVSKVCNTKRKYCYRARELSNLTDRIIGIRGGSDHWTRAVFELS